MDASPATSWKPDSPYTPTLLEWLALQANVVDLNSIRTDGITINWRADSGCLVLSCHFRPWLIPDGATFAVECAVKCMVRSLAYYGLSDSVPILVDDWSSKAEGPAVDVCAKLVATRISKLTYDSGILAGVPRSRYELIPLACYFVRTWLSDQRPSWHSYAERLMLWAARMSAADLKKRLETYEVAAHASSVGGAMLSVAHVYARFALGQVDLPEFDFTALASELGGLMNHIRAILQSEAFKRAEREEADQANSGTA